MEIALENNGALTVVLLIATFQVKHFLADFLFQTGYIIENRHKYGHPSGILHVLYHAIGSVLVMYVFSIHWIVLTIILLAEILLHYHIDWAKEQYNKRHGLTPKDKKFWIAIGFDQMLHQLTYVAIVLALIAVL